MAIFIDNDGVFGNTAKTQPFPAPQGITLGGAGISARFVAGDTSGTAVPAGMIGEQRTASNLTLQNIVTTNTWQDSTPALSLTPGVWALTVRTGFFMNSSTVTVVRAGISTSTGSAFADASYPVNNIEGQPPPTNSVEVALTVAYYVVLVTATTNYYGKVNAGFSAGTPLHRTHLSAVRVA
jgi:hypothetical protein